MLGFRQPGNRTRGSRRGGRPHGRTDASETGVPIYCQAFVDTEHNNIRAKAVFSIVQSRPGASILERTLPGCIAFANPKRVNHDAIEKASIMRTLIAAAGIALMSSAALAQTSTSPTSPVSPPAARPGAPLTPGAGPGSANSGPGSTGSVSREGTGAGTVTNNAAGGSNAGAPAQANPNTGKGGTVGGGGG